MSRQSRSKELAEQRVQTREEAVKKQEAADLARAGELRTKKVTNRRGRQTGTAYEKWDGKKWTTVTKEEYDKGKENKQTPPNNPTPPTSGAVSTPPPKKQEQITKPIPNRGKKEKFRSLRYPQDAIEKGQDFIKFTAITYKRQGLTGGPAGADKANILGTILLPIPSQINDNNTANYGSSSMNNLQAQGISGAAAFMQSGNFQQAGGNLKGIIDTLNNNKQAITSGLAVAAVNAFGGNITLDQVLARSQGTIINPNQELLFSGPGLRQFKFSFKFTPRFQKESDEIKTIIKAFKRNMAPKGSGGDLLRTPNIFQIQYMQGDQEHSFLNKFKLCALTNMSVNYTGDGVHATYYDGTPISMQMDLSFSELTPIYNEDYDEYDSKEEGVGY
jgi:hypothetical protein